MIVVIPTNRGVNLDYLRPLIEAGARFIIIDDSDGNVRVDHGQFEVWSWRDRRRVLGSREVAVPKGNGACRDLGFYLAWKQADADEIVVALDDDCLVEDDAFATRVTESLAAAPRPVARSAGRHLNILELYQDVPTHLYPRGFPYSARIDHRRSENIGLEERRPLFSLGLWRGVFDVNAIDKIQGPPFVHSDARLREPSVAIAPGNLVSVCSMNMSFRREIIPAAYQLPMNVPIMPGWTIDRYGDIWGGFILKTLMDIRGDVLVVGEPMIRHLKAGDEQRNMRQEHACHLVNDDFLELLDEASARIEPAPYLDMMRQLCEAIRSARRPRSPLLAAYLGRLTEALGAWTELLGEDGSA